MACDVVHTYVYTAIWSGVMHDRMLAYMLFSLFCMLIYNIIIYNI